MIKRSAMELDTNSFIGDVDKPERRTELGHLLIFMFLLFFLNEIFPILSGYHFVYCFTLRSSRIIWNNKITRISMNILCVTILKSVTFKIFELSTVGEFVNRSEKFTIPSRYLAWCDMSDDFLLELVSLIILPR